MLNILLDEVREMQEELILIRQDLHAHPELGMDEVRTSSLIVSKLKQWDLIVTEGVGKYGVIGTLKSVRSGNKSVGLRADMDGLKLIEQTNVEYLSKNVGKMHACGHDGHMTMLLGAAKYLSEHRDSFCGTVHFIFQPAEEGQKGAIAMINEKLFDRFPIDAIYGLHNYPDPLGTFTICTGAMMAAADRWFVTFKGTGGHGGATPHLATDVTVLQAQFILSLQTIVSRNIDPLDSAVISVGAIETGSFESVNVMPDRIRIGGTARSFKNSVRDTIEQRINQLANGLANSFHCTTQVEYIRIGTPLINHQEQTKRAIKAAEAVVGQQNVDQNRPPSTAGEDFAFMLLERPGAFIFMGTNQQTNIIPLHSPIYDFNDHAIPFGVAYWIKLVQQELNNQI